MAPAPGVGISAAVERGRFLSQGFASEMKDDVSKLVDSASSPLLLLLQLFVFSGFPAYEVDTLNHVLAKIVNPDIRPLQSMASGRRLSVLTL